jgi:hypothetical protein
MSAVSFSRRQWRAVLRPRWLWWHAFTFVAFFGMLGLGDWQLHRALTGNELSWAYTFEWPLFAIFTVYFWAKTVWDELRLAASTPAEGSESAGSEASSPPVAGQAMTGAAASGLGVSGLAASGLAASGLAASGSAGGDGAGSQASVDDAGLTGSHRAEGESQADYAARLIAEIRGNGRGRWRALQ